MSAEKTSETKPCPRCGKTLWWWKHGPDAVNPIGLWHHETEEEEEKCGL